MGIALSEGSNDVNMLDHLLKKHQVPEALITDYDEESGQLVSRMSVKDLNKFHKCDHKNPCGHSTQRQEIKPHIHEGVAS